MTLDVYAHFVPEADRRAADLLAGLLERERDDGGRSPTVSDRL